VIAGYQKFEQKRDTPVVFKSIGLISQDMILAEALLDRANQEHGGAFFDVQTGLLSETRERVPA
jgi:ornithine cyclodeaminase/alanine dehydrogenase-like protein (mu-crystallin family)